jgi:hypothetical protein
VVFGDAVDQEEWGAGAGGAVGEGDAVSEVYALKGCHERSLFASEKKFKRGASVDGCEDQNT